MDNRKFEQLIDLIINENEEQARALFHDIVVEKSREIYESLMDEEMTTKSPVDGLLDEISYEEQGMTEEEEDEFADIEMDDGEEDMEVDLDSEEGEDEGDLEDLEDRVVDLEDKLDELMAEFEELMDQEEGEEEHGDMGDEEDSEDSEDFGDEEMMESEATLEEAVQLQKVSVTSAPNGDNTKSIVSGGSKVSANGAKAVNFTSGDGGTGGKAPAPKDLKGAGQFKNAPGQKGQDLTAAPKPKAGDNGADSRSPVAESRKSAKKIVK